MPQPTRNDQPGSSPPDKRRWRSWLGEVTVAERSLLRRAGREVLALLGLRGGRRKPPQARSTTQRGEPPA